MKHSSSFYVLVASALTVILYTGRNAVIYLDACGIFGLLGYVCLIINSELTRKLQHRGPLFFFFLILEDYLVPKALLE